ncbi:MAG: site-specific integrase [Meiothermus sp.]|uniref:tyrosine-type recombinase/integrase n=1 Tax=Meiothermus sp. TaxID=1955249 RepID=UPI0025CB8EBE|nr:site-specific integrase [Meiothermus sp.]MCS7068501.1 site-specific integrase [Meiothermus sp.]
MTSRAPKKRPHGAGTKPVKRGNRWYMQVSLGRRPDGRPDRRWVGGATPEEAQQKARELQVAAAQGMLPTHERLTLGEWLHTWLKAKERDWAANTQAKHEQAFKRIAPVLGGHLLRNLRPHHIDALVRHLQGHRLGPTTIRMTLTTLSAALDHAVRMEILPRNPSEPVRLRLPTATPKVKAWDAETVARFLEAARPYRLYPLFYLGFATGLRREELLGLRWEDVDLSARCLRVERTLTVVKGQIVTGPPKTRHSRRVVGFGPDVAGVLEEWRARQREEARILGSLWQDTGLVFTTSTGGPVHPNTVNRDMAAIIKRCGLPPLSPHGMRHTHATLLAQKTRQIELVSRRLGHARPSITLDLYRHVAGWELEEVALPLNELLAPAPRTLH